MKMKSLGMKSGGPCCAPSPSSSDDSKEYFPSLYIDSTEELDLPDEGTAVIRFKKTSSSETKDSHGERYTCTLEVRSIGEVSGKEKVASSPDDSAAAVEALLAKVIEEREESDEGESY